jgi:cobalamin biosynthesis protein CobD/CbiB
MTKNAGAFLRRVGSVWSGYLPLWGIAITLWCVNSTVLLGFALSANQFLAALLANVCAAAALMCLGFLWRHHVNTQQTPLAAWRVFLAGSVVGMVKGATTAVVFGVLTGVPLSLSSLIQSTLPALLIGMWLLPAFGIIGSLREEFARERAELISEMVSRDLNESPSRYLSEDVASFVERAKVLVTSNSHSEDTLREALTELAERDVRPLSHQLWQHEEAQVGSLRFQDLVRTTLRLHHFPALWTSLSLLVSLLFLQIPLVGFVDALLRSSVQTALAFLFLLLGKLIPFRGNISGTVVFFLVPLLIVVVIEAVTITFFGPLPGVTSWIADVALFIALTMTLLVLGTVFTAKETHDGVRQRLSMLRADDLAADANKIVQLMRRRETAELLHGYVQNQLLAHALQLATQPDSLHHVTSELDQMLTALEHGDVSTRKTTISNVSQLRDGLEKMWRGVMNITMESFNENTLTEDELTIVDRLCQECASNARRHGHATHLSIQLSSTQDELTLTAMDNGKGLGTGVPGLGTALLNTLSAGRWSRQKSLTGTGTTVLCTIPRLKDN